MFDFKNFSPLKKLKIWCIFGLLLSVYTAYVELRAEQDPNYVALCDVSPRISCTAVFTTVYGRGFGILQNIFGTNSMWIPPNGVFGFLFYSFLLASTYLKYSWINYLRLFLSILSNLLSLYLAYLLSFVLQNVCFICIAIYTVNINCLRQIRFIDTNQQIEDKTERDTENEKISPNKSAKKSQ